MLKTVYIGSLVLGGVLGALLTLGSLGLVRRRRRRGDRRRLETATHTAGGPGVLLLLAATTLGAIGLTGEYVLPFLPPALRAGLSAALSLTFTYLAVRGIRAYFRPVQDQRPLAGASLVGVRGHLAVGIPAGGTGAVAYYAEGKRLTRPARAEDDAALPLRCPVRIVAFRGRTAYVVPLTPQRRS